MLNAVTDQRYEEAIKEAREVDKLIEAGLSEEEVKNKPFLGKLPKKIFEHDGIVVSKLYFIYMNIQAHKHVHTYSHTRKYNYTNPHNSTFRY